MICGLCFNQELALAQFIFVTQRNEALKAPGFSVSRPLRVGKPSRCERPSPAIHRKCEIHARRNRL